MYTRVAFRYASALFAEAKEQGVLDAVQKDMASIKEQFRNHPLLQSFLQNPTIGRSKKLTLFTEAFKPVLSPLSFMFLQLLNSKGREAELDSCLGAFEELYNDYRGIAKVVIRSAVELDEAQKNAIKEKVREQTGKNSVLASYEIDAGLIGGFTVQMGNTVLDGSIRRQLERLRTQLNEGGSVLGRGSSGNGLAAAG